MSTTVRKRAGRPPGPGAGDSREALLRAAHELLLRAHGTHVPVSEICDAAGINVAMIRYHFGSKNGLLVALLERVCAAFQPVPDALAGPDRSARLQLERHIADVITGFRRYPYANRVLTELLMQSEDATAQRIALGFAAPLTRWYAQILGEGHRRGEFRPIDPVLFFFSVIGAGEFLYAARPLLAHGFGVTELDPAFERRHAEHTARLLLDGIGAGICPNHPQQAAAAER